ncbi:hypothetical protein BOX15_Mlig001693g2, partial [Macrostomum lignano]
ELNIQFSVMSVSVASFRAMRSGLCLTRCLTQLPRSMSTVVTRPWQYMQLTNSPIAATGLSSRIQQFSVSNQLANKPDQMSAQQLLPGCQAPDFAGKAVMPDQSFADISLANYRGKYVVLFFYPADFTFVCPTEIIAFSDRAEDFRKANCELVACSTDTHFVHLAWTNTARKDGGLGRLNMPLLADPSHAISRAYGVLKGDEGIAFRGLFIINEKGQLRQITINDLPVGRSVDETFRLVQAFQFTDKHGEVCPANWKPGAKTMKPDPVKSKDYFQSV